MTALLVLAVSGFMAWRCYESTDSAFKAVMLFTIAYLVLSWMVTGDAFGLTTNLDPSETCNGRC